MGQAILKAKEWLENNKPQFEVTSRDEKKEIYTVTRLKDNLTFFKWNYELIKELENDIIESQNTYLLYSDLMIIHFLEDNINVIVAKSVLEEIGFDAITYRKLYEIKLYDFHTIPINKLELKNINY